MIYGPLKIVSGGQTGVDQGGLAAALDRGTPCGGWCPEGRQSECGVIPEIYPVCELQGAGYSDRTLRNVRDSDGTAIIFFDTLEGGTQLTMKYCIQESKSYVLVDASATILADAGVLITNFITAHQIQVLNVAGPRASKWPQAQAYAQALLTAVLVGLGY